MAFGSTTVNLIGGAVQDLMGSKSHRLRAKGQRLEAQAYDESAGLAEKNKLFSKVSTDIKMAQQEREFLKTYGGAQADVAAAGFSESGSALDLLRESASQGALAKSVLSQQGLMEEESYAVQAKSFRLMAEASRMSAEASENAAKSSEFGGIVKLVAAGASLFTGGLSGLPSPGSGGEQ